VNRPRRRAQLKNPGAGRPPTRPADDERRNERVVRCRVLLHQVLQGFRHPMDGMGWRDMKSLRQLLVGDGGLALRDVFEECAHPCMRRHPIVLSPKLGVTSGMVTSSHRREWASIEMRTSLPAYPAGNRRFESRSLQRRRPSTNPDVGDLAPDPF
jgi:hypothetical protein